MPSINILHYFVFFCSRSSQWFVEKSWQHQGPMDERLDRCRDKLKRDLAFVEVMPATR